MRNDTFRPPFGASVEQTPRECVFIGSMNDYQYLEEDERRYWPVRCDGIDLVSLMRDRDQLWAEAVHIMKKAATCPDCLNSTDTVAGQLPRCSEHRWWLNKEEEEEAAVEAAERVQDISWKLRIHEWWLDMPVNKRPAQFTVEDVAVKALKIDEDRFSQNRGLETAIGIAVRALGFRKKQITISKIRHWVYVPNPDLAEATRKIKPTRTAIDFMEVIDGGKT